ncbi:hypothetical protein J5N97_014496 [Dioscorea zingiberensis]|uniref:Uncharacterized protein n=1 Tax=Dioscorea zingiberensis TaxID=325984 RepID=A0A9D5HK47_9LILI|nr:hypothetical protein J5N97_014496 [Dioscorea zingiberensis]
MFFQKFLADTFSFVQGTEAIGVNYGMLGDNLPTPAQVVALYKSKNIGKLRLYNPDSGALQALQGSGIQVVLGTLNQDLQQLASTPSYATNWVATNDGSLGYNNLFDAIVDSTYSALEKAGQSNVEVVVSETGWPSSGGGNGATIENAKTYNNNVLTHVEGGTGTPKRPGKEIETYLFCFMFNENQKPAGTEAEFRGFFILT